MFLVCNANQLLAMVLTSSKAGLMAAGRIQGLSRTAAYPEVAVVDLLEEAFDAVVAAAVVEQQELHLGGRHKRRHLCGATSKAMRLSALSHVQHFQQQHLHTPVL